MGERDRGREEEEEEENHVVFWKAGTLTLSKVQ